MFEARFEGQCNAIWLDFLKLFDIFEQLIWGFYRKPDADGIDILTFNKSFILRFQHLRFIILLISEK